MEWNLRESLDYYRAQGAPSDQNALRNLLQEIQAAHGGSIPQYILAEVAQGYGLKESFLLAIIRRTPRLRLGDQHCLELCAGPNCGKSTALAACAEKLCAASDGRVTLKYVPCMRLCGKGPNIRYDGVLHHRADEALLRRLTET